MILRSPSRSNHACLGTKDERYTKTWSTVRAMARETDGAIVRQSGDEMCPNGYWRPHCALLTAARS